METKKYNTEKSLRIQELYNKSIEKCVNAAKEQQYEGIFLCTVIPIAAYLVFVDPPMAWLKGVTVVALTLMFAFTFWYRFKVMTRMSQASDVDELLSINDAMKKYRKYSFYVGLVLMAVAYGILHYKGSVNAVLMTTLPFCAFLAVVWAFSGFSESKDCAEIKEIKQLLNEE
jgi:hypothetical protein